MFQNSVFRSSAVGSKVGKESSYITTRIVVLVFTASSYHAHLRKSADRFAWKSIQNKIFKRRLSAKNHGSA